MVRKKIDYKGALDLIRKGHTSKSMKDHYESYLSAGISKESIDFTKKIIEDYETGKIKVTCTPEDKKRIIKDRIQAEIAMGMTPKEAETEVREDLKLHILKFIS